MEGLLDQTLNEDCTRDASTHASECAQPHDGGYESAELSNVLFSDYERTKDDSCLDDSITLAERAVAETPPEHPDRAVRLGNLCRIFCSQIDNTRSTDDRDLAMQFAQLALEAIPPDPVVETAVRKNIALLLSKQQEIWPNSNSPLAIVESPLDHPHRAQALYNWAAMRFNRFERTGDLNDIGFAIRLIEQSIKLTPPNHPDRGKRLSEKGEMLFISFQRTGNIDDLRLAINYGEEAMSITPLDHPKRTAKLNNMFAMLSNKFMRTGNLDDRQLAINYGEESVLLTPLDHPSRGNSLDNLGAMYARSFSQTGNLEDLNLAMKRAIEYGAEAMLLTLLNHPDRSTSLENLIAIYARSYDRTGNIEDLHRAIKYGEEAIAATPLDHPNRGNIHNNLGNVLFTVFKQTGNLEDLHRSIKHGEEAISATPLDHPNRARNLRNLGNHLESKYENIGSEKCFDDCLRVFTEAWHCKTSPPLHRIGGARRAVVFLAFRQRWKEASSLLEGAIAMMPKVSPRSLGRDDQQHMLSTICNLATDAGSVALQAGEEASHALQLLELGRGIIIGYVIDCRSDLTDLRSTHPDISDKFDSLRFEVDTPIESKEKCVINNDQQGGSILHRRVQAIDELEEALIAIRQLPGHEGFLLPPPPNNLMTMATDGPIVVFNCTNLRSDAIIVTSSAIQALTLPKLAYGEARGWMKRMSRKIIKGSLRTFARRNKLIQEFLLWLWNVAVEPVFAELQRSEITGLKSQTRVWWIGVGMLSMAPFHAAGDHSEVVLLSRRWKKRLTASLTSLKEGRFEQQSCSSQVPSRSSAKFVRTTSCTLRAMEFRTTKTRQIAVCSFNLELGSGEPEIDMLSVRDISNANVDGAQLAYLSACCTAENPSETLADEAIHIASGFQLAGFSHVLATMWGSGDVACMELAKDFYGSLFNSQESSNDEGHRRIAVAWHNAVKRLRDTKRNQPLLWAPFIHTGA
ncbi:CHAT domain-containing protein [Trichophaea hybrida]|nr:CHAT domain-containing protein [Trichophaea hybrida]